MSLSRAIMWIVILVTLVIGAGSYWFFTREFKGQAAETVNIAHTEALTGSSLGLVGYWTFDGNDVKWSDTTTEIKDTSGNAKHGDAQGSLATTSATSGKTGQALSFNGTSDVVSLGNVYNGVKTVAFWAKPNSTTQPFIDLNGTATINVTTGTVAANSFTSPTIYVDGTATSTFPDTNWHHVVVTTGTSINASAVNLGKISSSYFGGILDDVRFYSSTLSSTQVTDLYRASSAKEIDNANHREALTNGLVGYWTFDGRDVKWSDVGTEIKDISGNANHGAVSGLLASSAVRGKLGQALSFNGTSDYIYSGVTNLTANNDGTACAWYRGTSDTEQTIFHVGDGTVNNFVDFQVGPALSSLANEIVSFAVEDGGIFIAGVGYTTANRNELFDGRWHHVCLTADTQYHFYIDGSLKTTSLGSGSNNGVFSDDSDYDSASIGYSTVGYGYGFLNGSLDDVRIYNRTLSATEIMNLYNIGK